MIYMLDTNVLMHFANDKLRHSKILKRIDAVGKQHIFVSSLTIHEVQTKLIKAKVSPKNVTALAAILAQFNVRSFNAAAAVASAKVRAALEEKGAPIGAIDMLLAGHAKHEKAVLVTNNTKHFKLVHGLKVEDWIL